MEAIKAHVNIEINGRDNIDDGIATDPHPTHRDALKAASTIHRYIKDLNDPSLGRWKLFGLFQHEDLP